MVKRKIKILMLAAEAAPIAKVGGLGDVVGALPKDLNKIGADIRLVIPFYKFIDENKYRVKKVKANIWQTKLPGSQVPIYLLKDDFFNHNEIYSSSRIMKGNKYTRGVNDLLRFKHFTSAALEAVKTLKFRPDVLHLHDWHTALATHLLKKDDFFKDTKTIYTIHNLANQGLAKMETAKQLGIEASGKDINFMREGILNADLINTVSPTYAKEILTREQGMGLEADLKKRIKNLYGILNGIDVDFFNPAKDKLIKHNYSWKNLSKKSKNKLELAKTLGWETNNEMALVGVVTRFVWQKGIELITDQFKHLNRRFVFVGKGEKKYEEYLTELANKYPDKFKVIIGFDEALAHKIYAAADIFLMPSRFEPCGLGQMIAMRYGTVPVVRNTGGLADTVKKDVGFVFEKFTAQALLTSLKTALEVYYNKSRLWKRMQLTGMKKDFSWKKNANEYLKLYKKMIDRRQ